MGKQVLEKYFQVLCENGHQHFWEAELTGEYDYDLWMCRYCDGIAVWQREIDPMVGEEPTVFKIKTPATYCRCSACDDLHVKEQVMFEIPKEDSSGRSKQED
jgi:hypothetical protein